MHELYATQSLMEHALRRASEAGASRILAAYVVNGALSTIEADSVRLYWNTITPGTPAEGAALIFRHVPSELICLSCDYRFSPSGEDDLICPACGQVRLQVLAGREFYLEAIDVDTASDGHG